jgi:hypothetical protein
MFEGESPRKFAKLCLDNLDHLLGRESMVE